MKPSSVIGLLLAIPVIAWLPARFWSVSGEPWCLNVYPDWLDSKIYAIARPYLNEDMNMAAEQMEFLEVWIASVIILQLFTLVMLFLFKDKLMEVFKDEP